MLGVTALLLIVGVAALKGDAQRRLQLGIFLSLLFHASLLFWARQHFLSVVGAPATEPEWNLNDEVAVTIPDYHPAESESQASAELTKPAETSTPEEAIAEVTPQTPEKMKAEKKVTEQPEPTAQSGADADRTRPSRPEDAATQRSGAEGVVRPARTRADAPDGNREATKAQSGRKS